jgi:hypothetical protein
MRWKIWYVGGSTISGDTIEEWDAAPSTGVLGVYEFIGWSNGLKMCNLHSYGDWYWMNTDGSIGQSTSVDTDGHFVNPNNPTDSVLKQGAMTTTKEMQNAYSAMLMEVQNGN